MLGTFAGNRADRLPSEQCDCHGGSGPKSASAVIAPNGSRIVLDGRLLTAPTQGFRDSRTAGFTRPRLCHGVGRSRAHPGSPVIKDAGNVHDGVGNLRHTKR